MGADNLVEYLSDATLIDPSGLQVQVPVFVTGLSAPLKINPEERANLCKEMMLKLSVAPLNREMAKMQQKVQNQLGFFMKAGYALSELAVTFSHDKGMAPNIDPCSIYNKPPQESNG